MEVKLRRDDDDELFTRVDEQTSSTWTNVGEKSLLVLLLLI